MNHLEIDACLKSFQILVDSREQPTPKASKRYKTFGVPYKRQTLDYGDYTYNFKMPDGRWYFSDTERVKGHSVIERKMNLEELSQCFAQSRKRFEAEFERIKASGASSCLLIEDANWENLINGRYKTRFNPKAYLASLTAWMVRYNTKVIFCKSETSGKLIKEILYRELKERLERGEYG